MPADKPEIVVYCNCMEDVKRRLAIIRAIVSGHSPLGREDFDGEVACLHLRKSLELIAFSSLSAHRDAYAQVHNDFATHWNAKRLLAKLEKVHPDFYPKPVEFSQSDQTGVKHLADVKEGFLTRDEFVFLYDKCSEVIHARNPFKAGPPVVRFERSISDWVVRIQRLLDVHWIRLVESTDVWVVQMHQPVGGKVHAYYAQSVQTPTSGSTAA
jgi:hypothetical protein